jgi:subtilisin family serine protease
VPAVTAVLGSRLSAILTDFGIAHQEDPNPVRRGVLPPDARAQDSSALITVMVEVSGADLAAVGAAGLRDISPGAGTVVSGHIRVEYVTDLVEVPGVVSVEIEDQGRPDIHSSVPATHADTVRTGTLGLTGTGVIVGVVDSGIDIFHQAFRKADGKTRLLSLRDLTAPYTLTATGVPTGGTFRLGWTPPDGQPGSGTQQQTPAIAFNATAQQVLAALGTIAAIQPGDVAVTGGPLPGSPIVIAFQGRYLHKDVNLLLVSATTIVPGGTDITVVRGREYTRDQIDTALGAPPNVFMSWDEVGHGTHVMGIAAGNGSQAGNCHLADYFIGVAPEADLVAVKTTFLSSDSMIGVQHVFTVAGQQATAVGHPVAAVVNLSLGGSRGARNGSTQFERDIDAALATNPEGRVIVNSAGNEGRSHDHNQPKPQVFWPGSASHSRKTVPPNSANLTMTAVVIPNDKRDDEFDFWYTGAGRLSVTVKAPLSATTVGPVAPDGGSQTLALHGHSILINSRTNLLTPGTHNIFVRISPPANAQVRAGEWVFTLTETAGAEVDLHCWIGTVENDPHPRFINSDQDRQFTLGSPATARRVITVANYDHRDNTIAQSSSRGPTTDTRTGFDTKPDIAAPGQGILSAKSGAKNDGICCDCCNYDFYTTMSGTSMAAPHITGIIALILQRNRTLTWEQIRAHLRTHAEPPDPITGPTLPNDEWGAGIVNAETTTASVPASASVGDSPWAGSTSGDPPAGGPLLVGATPTRKASTTRRAEGLSDLRAAVLRTPAGQLGSSLVSAHLNEAIRLVNTDRRVTVAWHRMGGPALMRAVLDTSGDATVRIPEVIDGRDVAAALERFLDALYDAGSLPLRADIEQHRPFLLSLPGLDIAELESIDVAG